MSSDWSGTHIQFRHQGSSETGKTSIWLVTDAGGGSIGRVKWFGRWRKYSFFPAPDCVFEQVCLREIAEFIENRTTEHRTRAK
jgi:hypothetical protein